MAPRLFGSRYFDLPHSIAIDGDLIYVGDRDNARIQIFDQNESR
jgi:hypothetical protein